METKNPNKTIDHSDMEIVNVIIQKAVKASGYSQEQILSESRIRPLPAIRWMIGDKLMSLGFSSMKVSKILNMNHATLLYGRKQITDITARNGWREEIEILSKFKDLCKLIN